MRKEVSAYFPAFIYSSLIDFLVRQGKNVRPVFGYTTKITIDPRSIVEEGLTTTLFLTEKIKDSIIKLKSETTSVKKELINIKNQNVTKEEKQKRINEIKREIVVGFYEAIQDDYTHKQIIKKYTKAREKEMFKRKKIREKELRELKPYHKAIIPTTLADFSVVPCLKEVIERGLAGINLRHEERLIFLYIAKWFLDDNQLQNFYSSQPDYDSRFTQYMIDHNRSRGYMPVNCLSIINDRVCTCGTSEQDVGCCGTTIYRSFIFPQEVYDRVKAYHGET
jgi:hypothetical protein